jgi:hypothetical protein
MLARKHRLSAVVSIAGTKPGARSTIAVAYCLSMIFSDLPSPAEAGFAQAGNRYPLFGIML